MTPTTDKLALSCDPKAEDDALPLMIFAFMKALVVSTRPPLFREARDSSGG
jgi:hypothetical protein